MTNREGFTIVEILLAVVLLSFVVMGFQAVTGEITGNCNSALPIAVQVCLINDQQFSTRVVGNNGSIFPRLL